MRKTVSFAALLIILATIAVRGVERRRDVILRAAATALLTPLVKAQSAAVLTQSSFRDDEESAGAKQRTTCEKDRAKRG